LVCSSGEVPVAVRIVIYQSFLFTWAMRHNFVTIPD
jgi:hypothetical protein